MHIPRHGGQRQQEHAPPVPSGPRHGAEYPVLTEDVHRFQLISRSGHQHIRRSIRGPQHRDPSRRRFTEKRAAHLAGIQPAIRLAGIGALKLRGQHRDGQTEQARSAFTRRSS